MPSNVLLLGVKDEGQMGLCLTVQVIHSSLRHHSQDPQTLAES